VRKVWGVKQIGSQTDIGWDPNGVITGFGAEKVRSKQLKLTGCSKQLTVPVRATLCSKDNYDKILYFGWD
jgi:hypothetical protein